jgi:LysM repeat protein
MNRDDENEEIIPRPPTGGQRRPVKSRADRRRDRASMSPMAGSPLGDRGERTAARPSLIVPLPEPPLPRGPSYPAWERPLTHREFPLLRGQEQHRPWWPLIAVGLAVVIVLIVVVLIPMAMGNNPIAHASPSAKATPTAQVSGSTKPGPSASGHPSASLKPSVSQGPTPTPGPTITYKKYTVVAGDSAVKIATKFGLKTWELLLANPQLGPSGTVKVGQTLNIPEPGQLTPPPAATPTPTDTPTGG